MSRCLHIDDFHRSLTQAMPRLRERAAGKTGCDEQADDLVQDTLVKALTLGRSPAGCDFVEWICSIMESCWNYSEDNVHWPGERHSKINESCSDSHAALQRLQPELRSILQLALNGLKYKDIAAIEGIPIGTVMSRLFRARAELRAIGASNKHIFGEPPRTKRRSERRLRTPERALVANGTSGSKIDQEGTIRAASSGRRQDHRGDRDVRWGDTPAWFSKLVAQTSSGLRKTELNTVKMAPLNAPASRLVENAI